MWSIAYHMAASRLATQPARSADGGKRSSLLRRSVVLCGALVILIGAMALVARAVPNVPPIERSVALASAFSGLALLGIVMQRPRYIYVGAAIPVILSAWSLFEPLPAGMSPAAALSFIALATVFVLAQVAPLRTRSTILGCGGVLIAAAAAASGVRLLWGSGETFALGTPDRTALLTAGVLLLLGLGAAGAALDWSLTELQQPIWAPIGACIFLAAVRIALLQAFSPRTETGTSLTLAWLGALSGAAAFGVFVHLGLKAQLQGALLRTSNRRLQEEMIERGKAEQATYRANEQLEERVEERTAELESANQELRRQIAQRERVQEDLRRQKEIFESIFDHIPVMLNFVDRNGQIKLANREWERTLGWSLEEIERQNIDILSENYPDPEYRAMVHDFVANTNAEWVDLKTTVRDGRVIDTSWAMLHLSDGTGIGIGQDISKRKRAEEALRESEELFRELTENIRDLFWIKSPDFKRVLYLSPAYRGFSGHSPEERYAEYGYESFLDKIDPEDRGKVAAIMGREAAEYDVEFRIRRADGTVRWVRDRGFPIRDQSGRIYRIAGIANDITERKLAEGALRESEERFRQLTENIHEVFWLRSPDLQHLLYVSPMYEKVCGKTSEAIYAAGLDLEGVHPEDRSRVLETMQSHQGQEFEIEYRIVTKDGAVRWLRDRGFPIRNQQGQIYRMGGVAEDITDRKEAGDRLKASSDQLRALSASLQSAREKEATRIARQIHDEVGGILTGLRWELEAFEKTIQEPADPARLKAVQDKLAGMLGLTDTTINVVRRIASELRPSILDDLGLMEAIEWQAEQFQARTGIECRCDCALQSIPLGDLESTAVFRVVQEALTNIIRHAQATQVGICLRIEESSLILMVTDNGRGITQDERLSRGSLGLLGMQERAHLIGAHMEIAGRKGAGTTLRLCVPLALEEAGVAI
jgi:PAS domain S-box-containing protein